MKLMLNLTLKYQIFDLTKNYLVLSRGGQQRHFLAKLLRHFSPFSPFPHIQYAINNIQYAIAELIFLYQGWYLMGGGFCLKLYSAIELLVL